LRGGVALLLTFAFALLAVGGCVGGCINFVFVDFLLAPLMSRGQGCKNAPSYLFKVSFLTQKTKTNQTKAITA
jgi:hypothetical protein